MEKYGTSSNRKRQLQQKLPNPNIRLCIKSQDGQEAYYRCMSDKAIQKLLLQYCKDKNLEYSSLVFLFDGRKIKETRTPTQLGMDDGDVIDAMGHQTGGGYSLILMSDHLKCENE